MTLAVPLAILFLKHYFPALDRLLERGERKQAREEIEGFTNNQRIGIFLTNTNPHRERAAATRLF